MNSIASATSVLDEVRRWPGVSTQTTPRGSTAIVFEGHELGHVHADRGTLDLPLSDERRGKVLAAARAKEWFENWVTKRLANDGDAKDGIALLRESYDEWRTRSRGSSDRLTAREFRRWISWRPDTYGLAAR